VSGVVGAHNEKKADAEVLEPHDPASGGIVAARKEPQYPNAVHLLGMPFRIRFEWVKNEKPPDMLKFFFFTMRLDGTTA